MHTQPVVSRRLNKPGEDISVTTFLTLSGLLGLWLLMVRATRSDGALIAFCLLVFGTIACACTVWVRP